MKNTLFKNKKVRIKGGLLFSALLFAALIFYSACPQHIALGGGVDIERPSGEILYPDAGETPIRGSFILKGTAKDDEGVQAVSIVFENIETKDRKGPFLADLSSRGSYSTTWTADIDNESKGTETNHPLVKVYPIPDGEYTAIVTVTDNGGKTSKFTKNYKIDNTPPVFIVQRPSTIIVNDDSTAQADPYGSVFTVVGQAEDRSKIEDLTLTVDGTDISVSKKFVGKNINEEIAAATKNATEFTDPLYKYNDTQGSPKIKSHISLTDNARFFKGDGNEGEGNTSEWYYLRDRDIRSVLDKGYTADVINDYFAGKRGSASSSNKTLKLLAKLYDDNDTEGQSVKSILFNARIMTKADPGVTDRKFSFFTLDPNKSPGFKVTNGTNFPQSFPATTPDADLPHPGVEFFSGSVRPKVSLKLIPNKNGTPLVDTFNYNGYRASGIVINMYKCNDGVSYVASGDKKILNLVQSATPAYSLKFADLSTQDETDQVVTGTSELTVQWQLPNPADFSAGYYVIEVEGKDSENNDFVAYDKNNSPGGSFVIKFEPAGNHLMILPGAPSGFVKEAFHVIANVSSGQPVTEVRYKLDGAAGPSDTELSQTTPSGTEWKTAAPVSLASLSEGEHKVHFWAKSAGQTANAEITFIKDTTAPVPVLEYPPANAEQAGTVRIMGSVTDGHAGVNKDGTKYIIGELSEPTPATPGWRVMDKTTPVSWEFTYDLDDFSSNPASHGDLVSAGVYDIPVYILTEDTIGTKAVKKFTIRYDSNGDKPVVKVLSPQQNQTLGGTVQIFGTAAARLGLPTDIGEVYIQFSKNGDFNDTANGNMTFGTSGGGYDADWHKGGNGQLVPGTDGTNGGSNWQISINENGEFNNPSGQNWNVYFRVRAKNKTTNNYGPWSESVKIFIDKAYPTIGSPDPLKLVNKSDGSNPINYTSGMWITDGKKLIGSLYDDSGIKTVEISSPELLGNQKYKLQQALSQGWIAEDTDHPPASPGAKNYTLQIPLDLNTLSEASKRKGEISIKIKIVDMGQNLSREETVKLNFDITLPAGALGDFIYRYSGNVRVSSIADSRLAQEVKNCAPGSSPDYSKLHLLINDTIRTVTNVSGNTVSFAPNLDKAGMYNCLLYKAPYIIRNDGGNWIVRGVANDDGSGIKKIEATVTVDGVSESSGEITGNKITKHLGGQVSWEGEINLSTLKDGKGKLSCKIYDEQDNVYTVPDVDVVVKNKPIAVRKITLITDIGGTPKSFISDNLDISSNKDSNLDFTADFESSAFAFKNKDNSKIKVEFSGGQGTVKYRLKKIVGGLQINIGTGNLTAITDGAEIDLKNHFGTETNQIGNSNGTPTKIVLELWDEAHDFTPGTDSAFAKVTITTLFDALDDKAPKVVVLPFYWNGEGKDSNNNSLNSLYEGSGENGHVEIAPVTGLTANASDNNGYSSVSGKVTLRGFAYDNIKIHTVTAVLPGKTLSATLSGAGPKWTEGTMASDGAVLTVEKLGADYLGYYVKWTLDWDTEKTTSVGLAQEIKITVHDGTTVSSDGKANMPNAVTGVTRANENSAQNDVFTDKNPGQFVVFTKGEKQYLTRLASVSGNKVTLENNVPVDVNDVFVYGYDANEAKTNVNVVPFITGLERPDTYNTNRSSSGAYNLLRDDMVTITGFNLGGTGATVKAKIPNIASGQNVASNKFTLPAAAKSGSIVITVDPDGAGTKPAVEAINNKSNNSKLYNRQDIENRPETQYWTDDLTIDVWKDDEQFTSSNNPKYPSMAMGSNGDLYAAYSNYSESRVYYSKLGDAPQSVYYGYDPPEEAAISVKDSGTVNILYSANYHGGLATSWGASIYGAGGLYCYDANAPELSFYNEQGGKIYRFELFYHQKQLQQFKNFRIARKDNNIHIAYYDTLAASVKYSTVQSGTTDTDINFIGGPYDPLPSGNNRSEIAWVDLDGSTLPDVLNDPNLKRVGTVAKLVDGAAGQFENGLQRTGGTTEYCAIALDGSNRPVVVYADVDKGTLRLARANAAEPKTAAHWKVQKVLPAGDANTGRATDYFAAQFDSAGYLHIVFRNTKGQICYVKSTNANAGASAYTFEKSVVIAENGSRVELTIDGTTPYVAYLSKTNAYDGIQIAYYDAGLVKTWKPDGSADQTGAWNIMTAAMKQRASDARACIAVAPSSVTDWKAAVGYTPGSVYRVVKYVK